MVWATDLTQLKKRISTPAEEVFDGLEVLGNYLSGIGVGNLGPHDTWYVNSAAVGDDDGKSWSNAFPLMQSAVDACGDNDVIVLTGAITEDVSRNDYSAGPKDVTIIGDGYPRRRPLWLGAGTGPNMKLNCSGWTFKNIRFNMHNSYEALYLRMEAQAGGAYSTNVIDCEFQGAGATKAGVEMMGGPSRVDIINCFFHDIGGVGGKGIGVLSTGFGVPTARIIGNLFTECTNQILVHDIADSLFLNNYFQGSGHEFTTLTHLYITNANAGDHNIMHGNYFGGTFTIAGGYKFGSNDSFLGNQTDDISQGSETDDHGVVISIPI